MARKLEDCLEKMPENSRLQRGLAILRDYREGRLPDLAKVVSSQDIGDSKKIPIEGDDLYLIVQCYHARPRAQGRFEAHQRYTDVQYVCDGQEWIELCDLQARPGALPAYDANGNFFFPLEAAVRDRVLLRPGEGIVLFPNDAHAPCLLVEGEGNEVVRKIVIKVRDAHLPDAACR